MNDFLKERILKVKKEGKKGLIVYLMAGYPSLEVTEKLIYLLQDLGVTAIELGVPFSDPVADGPVIQAAGLKSLAGGTTLTAILQLLEAKKNKIKVPIILMTYYNPIYRLVTEEHLIPAKRVQVSGFIIPDLPFGESLSLLEMCGEQELELIPLIAPTTTKETLQAIRRLDYSFIYCIGVKGITGVRKDINEAALAMLAHAKEILPQPLYLGFGISNAEQIAVYGKLADGFIIGSAIVDLTLKYSEDFEKLSSEITTFIEGLNII